MRTYTVYNNPKSTKINKIFILFLLISLSFYIVYHLISGDRGFLSLFRLSKQYQILSQEIKTLEQQKQHLEKKVYMLKPESLNLDLLDEQVRRNLGYCKKGETVYIEE